MTHKELVEAIALTSGWAGVQEYETTTEEGKAIAQQVIAFLQAQDSQKEEHLYEYVDAFAEGLAKLGEH